MAFKYREEIVGKRFLSVSGPGKLKLFRISEWEWRSGVIRAVSHTDTKRPDLSVLVEFDDINWTRREWVRVQDQGNFQVFLVENTLVWAQRQDPFQNKNNSVYWPALNFKPIVDKIGLREHRVKAVEFLVDKNLAFVDDSSLKVYQDLDEANQLASKEYLDVKKAVKSWIEYQDGQSILLTTPSVLVGYRVEVYRSEGTTQWYTAVIVSYNHITRELTVTDDTVLEEHNEDPGLVQMKLIGDGVVDSILRGEKVGITPRRRTCTLQNPNNSIGHYSTRTRSQSPSHSTRSQVLTVSKKQKQQRLEIPPSLPEIEKSIEKSSTRLRSQRERKRKTSELEIAVVEEKKITNKKVKPLDISEIKEIEVKVQEPKVIKIKEKTKNKRLKPLVSSPVEKISTERRNEKRKTRIIDKAKKDNKKEKRLPKTKEASLSPSLPLPSSLKNTDIVSSSSLKNTNIVVSSSPLKNTNIVVPVSSSPLKSTNIVVSSSPLKSTNITSTPSLKSTNIVTSPTLLKSTNIVVSSTILKSTNNVPSPRLKSTAIVASPLPLKSTNIVSSIPLKTTNTLPLSSLKNTNIVTSPSPIKSTNVVVSSTPLKSTNIVSSLPLKNTNIVVSSTLLKNTNSVISLQPLKNKNVVYSAPLKNTNIVSSSPSLKNTNIVVSSSLLKSTNIVVPITPSSHKSKNIVASSVPLKNNIVVTSSSSLKNKNSVVSSLAIKRENIVVSSPLLISTNIESVLTPKSTNIVSEKKLDNIPCIDLVEKKQEPEPISPPKVETIESSESSTVIKCGRSSPSKNVLETAISTQQKRTTTNIPTNTTTTTTTVEAKHTKSKPVLIQSHNPGTIEQSLSKPINQSIIKSATDDRLSTSVTIAQPQSKVNEERNISKISNEQSAFNAVDVKSDSFKVTEIKRSKTSPSASPLVFDKNEPVKVWRDPNLVNADTAVRHITSLQHTTMHGHHSAAAAAATHSTVYTGVPSQPSHTAIGHPPMSSTHAGSQHSRSILPSIHYGQHPGSGLTNPHMLPHLEQHATLARGLPYSSVLPQATAHILSPYIHNDLLWSQKYGPMSLAPSQWMIIQNQEGLVAREQERALLLEKERKDRERLDRGQKEQHQRERELAERQRDHSDRSRQEREHSDREQTDRIEKSRDRESLHITSQDSFRISGQKKTNSPWNPISNNPRIPHPRIASSVETGSPATAAHLDKPRDQSHSSGPVDRVKLEAVERKRVGTPAGDDHHLRRTQELLLVQQEEEKKLLALQQAEMLKQQRQHEKEEEALKLQLQHEKDQRAVLKQAFTYKTAPEPNNCAGQDSGRNYKVDFPYGHISQAASYSGPLYTTSKASPLTLGMAANAHRIKQEPNFNLYGYQPFQHSYIAQDKLPLSTQGKQTTVEQPKTSYSTSITQTLASAGVKKNLPSPPQLVHTNENKQGHSVIVSTTSPGLAVLTTKESEVQKPLCLTNNRDCKGTLPMSPKQQIKLYQQQDRNVPVSIGNPPPLNTATTTVSRNNFASFKPYDMGFAGSRSSPLQVVPQPLDLQRIPKPAPTPPALSPSPKPTVLTSVTPSPSVIVNTTNTLHTTVAATPTLTVSHSNIPNTVSSGTSSSTTIPSRNSTPQTTPAHTSSECTSTTAQSTLPSWTSTTGINYSLPQQAHTSNVVYTEATSASKVMATCGSISSGIPINRPSITTTTASTHTNTNIAQPAVLFASISSSTQPVTTTCSNQPTHKRKPPKEISNRKRQKNDTISQSSTILPTTVSSPQFSTATTTVTTTVTSLTTTVTVPSVSTTTLTTSSSSTSNNIQLASANRSTGFIDSFKSFVQSTAQLSQQEHFYSKHAKGRHKTKALPSKQPPNQTLSNSASTSGSESTRVSNGMADSDSDTVGTASSPPLNRDTSASPGKTNNPPKLKKAWLQRHSDEDKKEASKKQIEVSWQVNPEDLQQNQQQQLQSVTPSQPKDSKPTHSYSTRLVNGHVSDSGKPHLDDSTSSASETEAEMIKRKVKTKRRKTSSAASKRSKNNSESDGLLEDKLNKQEETKQEIKVELPNPEKPVPKKRGRKPKDPSAKTGIGLDLPQPGRCFF